MHRQAFRNGECCGIARRVDDILVSILPRGGRSVQTKTSLRGWTGNHSSRPGAKLHARLEHHNKSRVTDKRGLSREPKSADSVSEAEISDSEDTDARRLLMCLIECLVAHLTC